MNVSFKLSFQKLLQQYLIKLGLIYTDLIYFLSVIREYILLAHYANNSQMIFCGNKIFLVNSRGLSILVCCMLQLSKMLLFVTSDTGLQTFLLFRLEIPFTLQIIIYVCYYQKH